MRNDTETAQVEKYLASLTPPEAASPRHFQELRGRVLAQVGNPQKPSLAGLAWKAGVVCAVVACTAVAGVRLYTYYFEGVGRDGAYHFTTPPQVVSDENGRVVVTSSSVSLQESPAKTVEEMQRQLQEIEGLRARNQRELIEVIDTSVNGHQGLRVFRYKYVLSDGTSHEMNEGGYEGDGRTPEQVKQDDAEIAQLRAAGQWQVTKVLDIEYNGQAERLLSCAYTLADGRTQVKGERDPLVPTPNPWLSKSQSDELWRLVRLDKGTALPTEVRSLYGQTFTFTRRAYEIGGGQVVVMWDGHPEQRWELAKQDYDELRQLRDAGAGEVVGTYQEDVKGQPFTFEQRRYTLADGTVVVRSDGRPSR